MNKTIDFSPFLGSLPDAGVGDSGKPALGTPSSLVGRDVQLKPIDRILKSLASGPKSLKELIQPGEQFSDVLAAVQQLQALGYVEHVMGDDRFGLTASGTQANTVAS